MAGPSCCRVLLAVAPSRSAASMRRVGILAPLRCSALEDPGAGSEEGKKEKGSVRKQARGRPLWRRILFASKKTRSIMILNALTVIYGIQTSSDLSQICSYMFKNGGQNITEAAHDP
jgi:hypothetical protein